MDIIDIRSENEFNSITFSKFQKTRVKKELLLSIKNSNIEPACYWGAELICAGHFSDLWELIILYISTQIHLANPKLPLYVALRFKNFKEILLNGYVGNELELRNNIKIRKLFAELIATLCLSRKKHSYDAVKINKVEDFNITNLTTKLKAPNVTYANSIIKDGDPKELFIAINEFAFHLSKQSSNSYSACYWLEWVLEFELINKKKKEKCLIEKRTWANVNEKYQSDIIWIVWEVILDYVNKSNSIITKKIINSLLELFCIRYSSGIKRRRKYLLYNAISLLTEPVNYKIEIVSNINLLKQIVDNINTIYKDIKKSEIPPENHKLHSNSNLNKTVERLEKMKQIDSAMLNSDNHDYSHFINLSEVS
jgi:hypothetical protein